MDGTKIAKCRFMIGLLLFLYAGPRAGLPPIGSGFVVVSGPTLLCPYETRMRNYIKTRSKTIVKPCRTSPVDQEGSWGQVWPKHGPNLYLKYGF